MSYTTICYDIPDGSGIGSDVRWTLAGIGFRRTFSEWIIPTERLCDLPIDEWLKRAADEGFQSARFDVLELAAGERGKVVRMAIEYFRAEFSRLMKALVESAERADRRLAEAKEMVNSTGEDERDRHYVTQRNALSRAVDLVEQVHTAVGVFGLTGNLEESATATCKALEARAEIVKALKIEYRRRHVGDKKRGQRVAAQ